MPKRDRTSDFNWVENNTENLLQAVAECANALLGDNNLESGVNEAIEILGTSIDADRLGIGEHHSDSTGQTLGYMVALYEWLASETESQLHHPELSRLDCDKFAEVHFKFLSGEHIGGLIDTFSEPFCSEQKKLGVEATYAIPVIIKGQLWGFLNLDFCRTARELCEAEIAVLKTAATCIGSAIQRERTRRAKEAAERKALLQQQKAEELQKRDRLLNITAQAANALLNEVDLDRAIAEALRIVGEGIDTDRVCVMEHHENTDSSLGFIEMLFEWNSSYAVSQLQHPELHQISYEGIEDWYEQLRQGEAVGGSIEELPEAIRQGQLELGVKSMYAIPIIVEQEYWGVIGFDDCREAKQRTESEISILKATAACIGSAIQQSRISRQREQAERQALIETEKAIQLAEHNQVLEQRDRILAATAEASDILLREENLDLAINEALRIIGQAADTDRAAIAEHFDDPSQQTLGHVRLLYEWHTFHTPTQLTHSKLSQVFWNDVEEIYWAVSQGKTHSGIVDEMDEPFRSGQKEINVKSTYTVPIMVKGQFWGIACFDDCREETRRSEAELSILKTAAACIGGAIQRERIRLAKEAADRNILLEREQAAIEKAEQLEESNQVLSSRDRWLEATANAANKLLEFTNLDEGINAALKVLGESLDCDRVGIFQCIYNKDRQNDPIIPILGRVIYEWDSLNVSSQILHSELREVFVRDLGKKWVEQLVRGEWVGGVVDQLSEPFRSVEIELGVESTYIVPFFLNGIWWGTLSMDFCREARRLTLPEIAVFKTAASCIGSAIYRRQKDEALKESEKRYRTLFELSNEGIYRFEFEQPISTFLPIEKQLNIVLQNYRFAEANKAYYDQMGVSDMDELVQFSLRDFHGNLEQNYQVNLAIVQNGYQIRNAETEETNALGKQKFFLNNIVCDMREGLVFSGWCMQTDITELKKAQQNLLEAERKRITQLEESNRVLSLRDRWLEATANAANKLLEVADLDEGINAALKVLGESLDCDRVCVIQNIEDTDGETLGFMRCVYEWDSKFASPQIYDPEFKEFSNDGLEEWLDKIKYGSEDYVGGTIDEVPQAYVSAFIKLEIQSTYNVAIFVGDRFWGIIGIDFCQEARRLTLPEIAVFKTAASCVGSAIYRQQIQQEKEQAEKTIILEREQAAVEKAAELTKVNAVLSRSLNKLTDTADLDEFLGQVVLEITHQVGAVDGHIFLYKEDNNTLETFLSVRYGVIYQGAAEGDPTIFHSPFPADISPVFQYLLETKEISLLSTNNNADFTLWWEDTLEWHRRMGHQEAAAIALSIGDKPLGILGLAFTEKSSLKPEESELIYALTNQASLAIQLTNLAQQAQEWVMTDERNRMAREIHDTLAQAFTGISLQLEAAKNSLTTNPEVATERILQAKSLAKEGINEARRSVRALRPEALDFGLPTALHQLIDKMLLGTKIKSEISIEGETRILTAEKEIELFRIAQEALTNVIRHAQATKIYLQLICEPDTICLLIKDNGVGFDLLELHSKGFGLLGMKERSDRLDGDLLINSALGRGTEITVTVAKSQA